MKIHRQQDLPENVQISLERVLKLSDKMLVYLSYLSFIFSNILGLIYNRFWLALIVSLFLLGAFVAVQKYLKQRKWKIFFIPIFWISWVILNIAISKGLPEMQFLFFIYLFVLVIYRNKIIILLSTSLILLYNIILYFFLLNDFPFNDLLQRNFLDIGQLSYENTFWSLFWYATAGLVTIWIAEILEKRTISSLLTAYKQDRHVYIFDKNKKFAEEISKGNFNIEYEAEENDDLGKALNLMKNNLKKILEIKEKEKIIKDFMNMGVTKIDAILRTLHENLEVFSYQVVAHLIDYLKANQGAIFIVNDNNKDDIHLSLKACYAYDRQKYINKKVEIGEGLIGTMYLEKKFLYLKELPKNYIYIKSGLGKSMPKSLVISPLIHNKEIVGILEIASFNEFKDYELDLIKVISKNIASTIISIKIRRQTENLLSQSNRLTSEMKEKEEELRQNMEELTTTQEENDRVIHYLHKLLDKNKIEYNNDYE